MAMYHRTLDEDFIRELVKIVGEDGLFCTPDELDFYQRSSGAESTRAISIVKPKCREEVRKVVVEAGKRSIPLFTISSGKNWGYGDACAPLEGNLIVDLSRMNRILEVNKELAYAVVEPGVTQGQLTSYLESRKIPLVLDVTGAGPEASLIGNYLERGHGHTPYGEHFEYSCNYEVVLSDGSVIETGFGAYPNSQARHLHKWGVGPSLDGLFSQSNFGIVTRMTIWLMPKPDNVSMFIVALNQKDSAGPFFERIRRLRLNGTLQSSLHCFNDMRILTNFMQYPWEKGDGERALNLEFPEYYQGLRKKFGIPLWAVTGSIQGTKRQISASKAAIKDELRSLEGLEQLVFLDERKIRLLECMAGVLKLFFKDLSLSRKLESMKLGFKMLQGRPTEKTLFGAHWRGRLPPQNGSSPLDTQSGLAWISPVLPMTAEAVAAVTHITETEFNRFGFEYQVTFTAISPRALIAIQSISFDRSNPKEVLRAKECQEIVLKQLIQEGYIPYRGPYSIMKEVWSAAPKYWDRLAELKRAWDLKAILSPSRYVP